MNAKVIINEQLAANFAAKLELWNLIRIGYSIIICM